jgi:glutamate synthase domain-containing protein 3
MPETVAPHPGFRIFAAANGNWIVEGPRCGGVFVDERAAERFVHDEERAAAVEPLEHVATSNMVRPLW